MAPFDIEAICASSFRDFHATGLDYLCLHRSPERTAKVYFFDDEAADSPEVVIPHTHRYDFHTAVLAGEMVDHLFALSFTRGAPYEAFDYMTPLNGGAGFTWAREVMLYRRNSARYEAGTEHATAHFEVHTISVVPGTVLMLVQGPDIVPLNEPTRAFRAAGSREPPSLDGLYRPMDADHARLRLGQFEDLMKGGRP